MIDIDYLKNIIEAYDAKIMGNPRESAIILLLVNVNSEIHILFTVRGESIRQPGETSFPGGGLEVNETPLEAALRETEEEVGIPQSSISVWGEIDRSASENHLVHCFVGYLREFNLQDLKINKEEVAEVYTVPLDFFLNNDPTYYKIPLKTDRKAKFPYDLIRNGSDYPFYNLNRKIPFYNLPKEYSRFVLWGYTANFVDNFIKILKENLDL
ncbi:MAG TPA: CoA pyrophosphatase [Candidatus Eisenbacteria bacterium]|nr:CoA pyrophosphatase [Candidatus Eisenbacteria bacterium]